MIHQTRPVIQTCPSLIARRSSRSAAVIVTWSRIARSSLSAAVIVTCPSVIARYLLLRADAVLSRIQPAMLGFVVRTLRIAGCVPARLAYLPFLLACMAFCRDAPLAVHP